MRRPPKLLFQPALLAVLVLALGLTACGRKGPLDPPPSAAVPGPAVAQEAQPPADGVPPRPVAPRRNFFLDPLID